MHGHIFLASTGVPLHGDNPLLYQGPSDPRVIRVGDEIIFTFNGGYYNENGTHLDSVLMYNYEQNSPIVPHIKGGSLMLATKQRRNKLHDKNWSAFVHVMTTHSIQQTKPINPSTILEISCV